MEKELISELVVAEISKVLKKQVDLHSSMENTHCWDSLKKIDIIFAIEDRFEIQFEAEVLERLNSVREITHEVTAIKQ